MEKPSEHTLFLLTLRESLLWKWSQEPVTRFTVPEALYWNNGILMATDIPLLRGTPTGVEVFAQVWKATPYLAEALDEALAMIRKYFPDKVLEVNYANRPEVR